MTFLRYLVMCSLAAVLVHTPARAAEVGTGTGINIVGPINVELALEVIPQIKELPAGFPATIHINSPGGSVFVGMEIAKAIEQSKADITCEVDGLAASMAFYILQSCPTRVATLKSVLMMHETSGNQEGSLTLKDVDSLRSRIRAINRAVALYIANRMQMPVEEYENIISNGEWWMAADEALVAKAVDRIR